MADFLGMMKQAAQLQSKMQEMQDATRSHVEVEGHFPAAVWSSVRMTAKMEVKGDQDRSVADEAGGARGCSRISWSRRIGDAKPQGRGGDAGEDDGALTGGLEACRRDLGPT